MRHPKPLTVGAKIAKTAAALIWLSLMMVKSGNSAAGIFDLNFMLQAFSVLLGRLAILV